MRNAKGPLPVNESMRNLRQAAQAIDYAHSRNVLHRDIKPANMLLQQDWLLLADFGIAKLLQSTVQRGQTHSGAGTPDYMAPEQIQGRAEPASDRYSLACVAYLLLTGQLPFKGETPYETLMKHMTTRPTAPRQINPALPPEVDQALFWGLAKAPADRPASCAALVDAIERGWNWKLGNLIDSNGLSWSPDGRTLAVVDETENKIYLFDAFSKTNTPRVYQTPSDPNNFDTPSYTGVAWSPTAGNTIAVSPSTLSPRPKMSIELWHIDHTSSPARTFNAPIPSQVQGHSAWMFCIGWSVDGTYVAGLTYYNAVIVWQAKTGAVKQVINLPDRPNAPTTVLRQSMAWSPVDPNLIVIVDSDIGTIWDVRQNKLLHTMKTVDPVPYITGITWSPNGKYIAAGYARSPRIYVWHVQKADPNAVHGPAHPTTLYFPAHGPYPHTKAIMDVEWSPDGRYIASASADETVIIWQVDA